MSKRPGGPAYCECTHSRRSDCRRGVNCRSLLVSLHSSDRPRWMAARVSLAFLVACGLAVVAYAIVRVPL